mgnify:CR=1 FL=1
MKTILKFAVIISFTIFITACSDVDQATASVLEAKSVTQLASRNGGSVINQEYHDAQAEVLATFGAIATSITNGAGLGADSEYMDQLISYHDYDAMFTEFNYDFNGNGFLTDSEGNEEHERMLFGEIVKPGGVKQFAALPGTLKVAVYYGNVANLTFTSDFILTNKTYGLITVNNLITLLFVKTKGEWKLVHEHHSPVSEDWERPE